MVQRRSDCPVFVVRSDHYFFAELDHPIRNQCGVPNELCGKTGDVFGFSQNHRSQALLLCVVFCCLHVFLPFFVHFSPLCSNLCLRMNMKACVRFVECHVHRYVSAPSENTTSECGLFCIFKMNVLLDFQCFPE